MAREYRTHFFHHKVRFDCQTTTGYSIDGRTSPTKDACRLRARPDACTLLPLQEGFLMPDTYWLPHALLP
jgi:hypothetical protein